MMWGQGRNGNDGQPVGELHGDPCDLGLATARPKLAHSSLPTRAEEASTLVVAAPTRRGL